MGQCNLLPHSHELPNNGCASSCVFTITRDVRIIGSAITPAGNISVGGNVFLL